MTTTCWNIKFTWFPQPSPNGTLAFTFCWSIKSSLTYYCVRGFKAQVWTECNLWMYLKKRKYFSSIFRIVKKKKSFISCFVKHFEWWQIYWWPLPLVFLIVFKMFSTPPVEEAERVKREHYFWIFQTLLGYEFSARFDLKRRKKKKRAVPYPFYFYVQQQIVFVETILLLLLSGSWVWTRNCHYPKSLLCTFVLTACHGCFLLSILTSCFGHKIVKKRKMLRLSVCLHPVFSSAK